MVNIKLVLLGDGSVGKTSIKNRFIGLPLGETYAATVGADFTHYEYKLNIKDEQTYNIQYMIYDLAGQPRFNSIRAQYMEGANVALFVYDVSNRNSYAEIQNWIKSFKLVVEQDVPLAIVGNKIDLREDNNSKFVQSYEGHELAKKISNIFFNKDIIKVNYVETSALENKNIDELFEIISIQIYHKFLKNNPFV